jgi:hypothetical protein
VLQCPEYRSQWQFLGGGGEKALRPVWHCVGFEVLTAVVMKSTVFWDITPCSPLKVNRRFEETSSSGSNKPSKIPIVISPSRWYLARVFRPWRWRWHVPPKRRLTLSRLHSSVPQKMALCIRLYDIKCS